MKYVLNTIAFKKQLRSKMSQANLIEAARDLGFSSTEIRSEFLSDNSDELKQIAHFSVSFSEPINYSVNDTLIKDNHFNPKFDEYVKQMKTMGAQELKMNIGQLKGIDEQAFVNELAQKMTGDFKLVVENNQTMADSNLQNTQHFFEMLGTDPHFSDVSYCFDIANWSWLDATAEEAAKALSSVTTYLHLKNVVEATKEVVSLDKGDLDWRKLVQQFPQVNEIGFEYAAEPNVLKADLHNVKQILGD